MSEEKADANQLEDITDCGELEQVDISDLYILRTSQVRTVEEMRSVLKKFGRRFATPEELRAHKDQYPDTKVQDSEKGESAGVSFLITKK